jgi:DNA polymerase
VPASASVDELRAAAPDCRGCELWEPATQVVFSAGDPRSPVMLVGEQPGDVEDVRGVPFVGPAGRVLQDALDDAGIARDSVYVTNAVKHFRFTVKGKRRIHATPELAHIVACRPWLDAELRTVDPRLVVVLGATAAKALLGKDFRVTQHRGELIERPAEPAAAGDRPERVRRFLPTVHPSSVLRVRQGREQAYADFVADLRLAQRALAADPS